MNLDSLTTEQRSVIDFLIRGDSVFLTGPGGVGKSYLLGMIYTQFPRLARNYRGGEAPRIRMTALTGCAALLLGHGAKTLHSWAGIGLGKGTVAELRTKIKRNRKALTNWLNTDLLVIDEVSMLTAELFDLLEELARTVRINSKFFGGIQLLCCGDMMQLPPIGKTSTGEPAQFIFEGRAWPLARFQCIELTVLQRQRDAVFQQILGEARMGMLSAESCRILREREGLDGENSEIKPTIVFPRRIAVDAINDAKLRELTGERHIYVAKLTYDGKIPAGFTERDEEFQRMVLKMDAEAAYVTELELAVGAQVMMLCNAYSESGLVNGSRGVVTGFSEAEDSPIVRFLNGTVLIVGTNKWSVEDFPFASRVQIPLRLAYAITTHKLQGASLDSAMVDIGPANFEAGQCYVTLSRVRELSGLFVMDFDPRAFRAHPKAKAFYAGMQRATMSEEEQVRIRTTTAHEPCAPCAPTVFESMMARTVHVHKLEEPGMPFVAAEPMVELAAPAEPIAPAEPGAALSMMFLQAAAAEAEAAMKEKKERAKERARERAKERRAAKASAEPQASAEPATKDN